MSDNDSYDVVVVGAGVVGLSVAYHLTRDNLRTLVLDQFPIPNSRGGSGGHTRMIRSAYTELHYAKMMPEAFEMWAQLERESGEKLIIQNGLLSIDLHSSTYLDNMEHNLKAINAPHERLRGLEISRRFPMFRCNPDDEAILDKTGGFILADKVMSVLLKMTQRNGGVIRERTTVLDIDTSSDDVVVLATSNGVIHARKVVIATGSWTAKLAKTLVLHLPIKPIRTSVCFWKESRDGAHNYENFPAFVDNSYGSHAHLYGSPCYEYPGLLKVGFSGYTSCTRIMFPALQQAQRVDVPPTDPDRRDRTPPAINADMVKQCMELRLPYVVAEEPAIVENCMYATAPDGDYIVDRHPTCERVIIASGMAGHGFKLAILIGRIIRDMVNDVTPSYDISRFRINRFANKSHL